MKFHMPTRIVFGPGTIHSLKELIAGMNTSRPYIITDKGIVHSGILEKITSQIGSVDCFDEIEPNPKSDTVNRAGDIVRRIKPDLIIALGGGSPMDAGKAIALLATNKGKIEEYEGREKYGHPPLPVLAIPTTCGTGSEVTWVSVITDTRRKFKMSAKGKAMFPAVALVDPDLLISLPKPIIASTGLDALTHAVEAYTVKPATVITDQFAMKSIGLISRSLSAAYSDIKNNHEARENLMLGSTLAGIAFGNSDVGAVHCIAESIGALFDIPHGVANSIFLPFVMKFNLPSCAQKYADIAAVFGINDRDPHLAAEKLIDKIESISRSLDIPSFRDLKIDENQFPQIAEYSYQNNSNPSNAREATVTDYMNILNDATNSVKTK
jgi:alcohol dehydrogenase